MRPDPSHERGEAGASTTLDIQVDTNATVSLIVVAKNHCGTYPSRTASPNGRVELDPPRNKFQIVSANVCAWESEEKVAAPVAPPRLRVTILPLAWHAFMPADKNWQFGRLVPGKTGSSALLQV